MARSKIIFIYVTCPTKSLAVKIANSLLREKLIACANILPHMEALYTWKGKTQRNSEVVLILKTKSILFKKVEAAVLKLHTYDCPCVIALPVEKGFQPYLRWIETESTNCC